MGSFHSAWAESFSSQDWRDDFPILQRGPGVVLYSGAGERLRSYDQSILKLAPQVWRELARAYPEAALPDTVVIFLTEDQELFQEVGGLDPSAGFLAVASRRSEGILILYPPPKYRARYNLRQTLAHEMAHILLYRLGDDRFPRYFHEGYAMVAAAEWDQEWTFESLRAAWMKQTFSLSQLDAALQDKRTALAAYAQAFGFANYLSNHYGASSLVRIVKETASGVPFDQAFVDVIGLPPEAVNQLFLKEAYWEAWGLVLYQNQIFFVGAAALLMLGYVGYRIRRHEKLLAMEREELLSNSANTEEASAPSSSQSETQGANENDSNPPEENSDGR